MNLPQILDASAIRALKTDDQFAVRVILRRVSNSAPFRMRCKNRTYIFERSAAVDAHFIDIPVSVWMAGANPAVPYRDNTSPAHDLNYNRQGNMAPLIFQVIPWKAPAMSQTVAKSDPELSSGHAYVASLRRLLSHLGAPTPVVNAFQMIAAGVDPGKLAEFVDAEIANPAESEAAPATDPAKVERARKMREARAAKRAAKSQ